MTEKESKNLLDIAIKSLEKEFGIGAVVKGDEAKSVRDITSSGSIALNNAICVGGYPDGSIIEVYGNEGTGKCQHINDLILLSDGQQQKLGNLIGQKAEVVAFDTKTFKMVYAKASFMDNGLKECLKIKLRSGKEELITKNHPLLMVDGWRVAKDLQVGDRIACPREYVFNLQDKITETEAKLLGYLVGDGGTTGGILFTNADKLILNDFKKLVKMFDSSLKCKDTRSKHSGRAITLRVSKKIRNSSLKNSLFEFICKLNLNCLAKEKRIPKEVFMSSNKIIALFLNRYFACDGYVSKNSIAISSASKGLINDVQHLLLRFGINSKTQYKPKKFNGELFDSWSLYIYGKENIIKFATEIGISGEKCHRLKTLQIIKEKVKANSKKLNQILIHFKKGSCLEAYKKLLDIYKTNLFWDEVVEIENAGFQPTVAVEVPKYQTYVANDIINHNTTLGLHAIAETQKKGKLAAFIDVEHGLELEYAEGIGVDTSTLYFSQPMHAREALTIVEELLKTGEFGIIVLDSIAALITEQELEGHVGDAHVAPLARLMSSFLKRISGLSRKTGTIVMFINQIRTDVGKMFGDPEVTPGGKALKFYATLRLNIKSAEKLKDGVEIIGNAVKVKIVKNKVGPPFKVAVFDLVFGKGIDSLKEVIELAVQKDFIIKSGAWYKFELDGEEKSFQGLPQLRKWFEENPTWYEFIYNKVCENDG